MGESVKAPSCSFPAIILSIESCVSPFLGITFWWLLMSKVFAANRLQEPQPILLEGVYSS